MSFGSNTSQPAQPKQRHPYGLNPRNTANAETGRPLPYFAGQQRLALTWLGPAYNQRSEAVKSDNGGGGKGDSGDEVVGYNYYADVAGVICLGPVDSITEIFFDQESVWQGNVARSSDSAGITIDTFGSLTIYWGTETQPIDDILGDQGHPAYRGMCYIVFEQLFFGQDKTQAPSVEVTLTRAPLNWIGAPFLGTGLFVLGANPVHCMVELMTHPRYGLGFGAAQLDIAQLRTAAAIIASQAIAISPLVDTQSSARDLLTTLSEYFDGYMSARPANLLRVLIKAEADASVGYPVIGEYDMTEVPQIETQGWTETVNEIRITFTDQFHNFDPDSVTWSDMANQAIVGGPLSTAIDRPFATSRQIAIPMAVRYGRVHAVPLQTAKITIRKGLVDDASRRRGDDIEVGSFVFLTYLDYFQTLRMRVDKKTISDARSQTVDLELSNDRYLNNVLDYIPDDIPGIDDTDGGPQDFLGLKVVEAHRELVIDDADADITHPRFVTLAARQGVMDTRVATYESEAGHTYRRLKKDRHFCLYGTLHADLGTDPRTSSTATIILDIPADAVDRNFESTTATGWYQLTLLAFIGDEAISYQTATLIGANQVQLTGIMRGAIASIITTHAAGDPVFVARRLELPSFSHRTVAPGDSVNFKVVTGTRWAWASLTTATVFPITVQNVTAMNIGPAGLICQGARLPPWQYTAGSDISLTWYTRSVTRHGFWDCWDHPWRAWQLHHLVVVTNPATGDSFQFRVLDAATPDAYDGTSSTTITDAQITGAFGGRPVALRIQIYGRTRGILSQYALDFPVTRSDQPTQLPAAGGYFCWPNSGLVRLARIANPEARLQDNFARIAAHWGSLHLPHATVNGVRGSIAKSRTADNLAAIAAFLPGTTFPTLTLNGTAGRQLDHFFEVLDSVW